MADSPNGNEVRLQSSHRPSQSSPAVGRLLADRELDSSKSFPQVIAGDAAAGGGTRGPGSVAAGDGAQILFATCLFGVKQFATGALDMERFINAWLEEFG